MCFLILMCYRIHGLQVFSLIDWTSLFQWSPTVLAPGTSYIEDSFPMDQGNDCTTHHNADSGSPELVSLPLDVPIWRWWETVYNILCNLASELSLQKTVHHEDRMLETKAGFSVLLWQCQDILPWPLLRMCGELKLSQMHMWRPVSFAISSSYSSSSRDNVSSLGSFTLWSVVFYGWKVMFSLFEKLRQVIMHQL